MSEGSDVCEGGSEPKGVVLKEPESYISLTMEMYVHIRRNLVNVADQTNVGRNMSRWLSDVCMVDYIMW